MERVIYNQAYWNKENSKLNSGNVVKVINSRTVAVIRYAGLIKTKDKLKTTDKTTRKTIIMYRAIHPQADVDRLYIEAMAEEE